MKQESGGAMHEELSLTTLTQPDVSIYELWPSDPKVMFGYPHQWYQVQSGTEDPV